MEYNMPDLMERNGVEGSCMLKLFLSTLFLQTPREKTFNL